MKTSMIAAAVAAVLLATPAVAQQNDAEHDAHHPDTPQATAPSAGTGSGSDRSGAGMPNMQGMMQGQGMQGMMRGMMNCPMMQGGMANMIGGQAGGMPTAAPQGDQSVGSLAFGAINQRMHREMMIEFTGDVDADFARAMIAHHRGAVDMAKVVAAFGDDPQMRELAENVIAAQEEEIRTMERWLEDNAAE